MKRSIAWLGLSSACVSVLTKYHSPKNPSLTPRRERDQPVALDLVAGVEERVPGRRRAVRIEPCGLERGLVVLDAETDDVPTDAELLALVDGEHRRARLLEDGVGNQTVQRLDVAEPDVLHVVDAVEHELDVRRLSGRGRFRELRDHRRGVHEQRVDGDAALLGEAGEGRIDPLLDPDRLLLAPPPHRDLATARRRRRRRAARRGARVGCGRRRGRVAPLVAASAGSEHGREPRCGEPAAGQLQQTPARECAVQIVVGHVLPLLVGS